MVNIRPAEEKKRGRHAAAGFRDDPELHACAEQNNDAILMHAG
jgi:hypothetical protein